MDDKIVSFAKHGFFYKIFYDDEFNKLKSVTELNFNNLKKGYLDLLTFYSSYSHYINTSDENIRDKLLEEIRNIKENEEYQNLKKILKKRNLKYYELVNKNKIYYNNIKNIFEYYEIFFSNLALDDILPGLTRNNTDYEKNVLFACYEKFYLHLFNLHQKINESFSNFNIINFFETYKILMCFYYGFSFYMTQKTKNKVLDLFKEIFEKYNKIENMKIIERILTGKIIKSDTNNINEINEEMFILCNHIFELINNDLPKKNLMPKKKEKVKGDRWGI